METAKGVVVARLKGRSARHSHISVQGMLSLSGEQPVVMLRLQHRGDDWIFAERVTIVMDGQKWESPKLNFRRDNAAGNVWEIAFLDMKDVKIFGLAANIARAQKAIVRFHGRDYFSDLELSDRMKRDLGTMVVALAYLGLHRQTLEPAGNDAKKKPGG